MTGAVEGRLAEAWVKTRTLHRPQGLDGSAGCLWCEQCATYSADGDLASASWPCATARVLFSPLEQAAALAGTPPEDEATT